MYSLHEPRISDVPAPVTKQSTRNDKLFQEMLNIR